MKHVFVVLAYKESDKLEECVKSVLNQSVKTNVVIATSTPNDYINNIAKKYKLKVIKNKESKGIGYDFDFASTCVKADLVTIAHQDDIYENKYAESVIRAYEKCKDATIIFTDYFELKNGVREMTNINLKIKRILLFPLRFSNLNKYKFFKRGALRFGCAICCPAVTFVTKNTPKEKFKSSMKSNIDWLAWEKLSKKKGRFIYISKKLMGHRIHEDSTTTEIIKENTRTKEDLEMLKKFWPEFLARIVNRVYKNSEKGNE